MQPTGPSICHTSCAEYEVGQARDSKETLAGAEVPRLVRGSAAEVTRGVANVVANALAYCQCADLSLHTEDGSAGLWIEDRRPGIPVAERTNVFEPFYHLEASRNRESGPDWVSPKCGRP
jgi:two-component system osmolarity sensor histidine kinase EnvZ